MQDRLFRALLRLLPGEFRAAYARDMEATFRAEWHEARARGGWRALAALSVATVGDLLRTTPGEHLDILKRDLRFAVRSMAARPLHTLTAVAMLAIGIGANVTMFAVVDAVLIRPLPYRDPGALVTVAQTDGGADPANVGYLTFVDLAVRSRSFSTLAAASASTATLTAGPLDPERVNAMRVSARYFDMLGVSPALGRTFTEGEDRPGSARQVVMLSDGLWRRRFQGDPGVVGRTIDIGGVDHRIVGVLPRGVEDIVATRLYAGAEVWYPLGYDPAAPFACRTCQHLRIFGRLAPGVAAAAAERELDDVFRSLEAEHPSEYHLAGSRVTPLAEVFLGPVRPALLVLWAGVLVLLLVASANVANLLLLWASERSHEIAVRTALGVTRGRLARQLMTESALLGALGGVTGLLAAGAAVRLLAVAGPAEIPRLASIAVDGRAAVAALILTMGCVVAFGLVPLGHLMRRRAAQGLRTAGGRQTDAAAVWRVRAALAAANVAMAALLLVGSGLLVRSLTGLLAVAPGFDPSGVLTMQIWASGASFRAGDTAQQIGTAVRFYDRVLEGTRALPAVTAAAAVTTLPLGGGVDAYGFHVAGFELANPESAPMADRFVVTPQFFRALSIPLLRGRLLDERDRQGTAPVVVIGRATEELFSGDAIGRQVRLGPPDAEPRTVVGVVGDVRHHNLDRPVGYQVYVPQAQWAWAETSMTLVVRSDRDPALLAAPVRELVRRIDPAQPISNVRPYDEVVAGQTGTPRFATGLLSGFAGIALLLAVVGLYGALGVTVRQRRQEIGVRIALGAPAGAIRRMILGQGLRPVGIGLTAGLVLAAASARIFRSLLYDVDALDPLTFAATATVLVGSGAIACLLPAWHAARIDPARILRE